ncbi:MAG: hypothetical protein WCB62_23415, partial [Pseudolabrys sp.]
DNRSSALAIRSNTSAWAAGREVAFALDVERRDDLNFDLAIGIPGNRAALSGVALPLQAVLLRKG